jgi:hypothetical protein
VTVAQARTRSGGDEAVITWLLDPAFPAVRRLTLLRLVGRPSNDPEVRQLDTELTADPWVAALLAGEWRMGVEGHVRVHPYKKWGGAHWRLVALAELGVTIETPVAEAALGEAFDQVAGWLLGHEHIASVPRIDGRYRRCGSQEGNALWAASTMRLGTPTQRAELAGNLLRWEWPDGGWNCDRHREAHHSSFNESFAPLRGLIAYRRADDVQDPVLDAAIEAAAEFLLRHRVVESERTGELANPRLGLLRWPPYWHYGLLPGLRALDEADWLADPRVRPAVDRLRAARGPDGTWRPDGRWWGSPRAKSGANVEIVDWGRQGETRMLTLHALEILQAAGGTEED